MHWQQPLRLSKMSEKCQISKKAFLLSHTFFAVSYFLADLIPDIQKSVFAVSYLPDIQKSIFAVPYFLRCLILSGWFDGIGIHYSSLWLSKMPVKCQISKKAFLLPTQNCSSSSSSFFFSKPSTRMADVGKLLWAQMLYRAFVWVQVYRWLP